MWECSTEAAELFCVALPRARLRSFLPGISPGTWSSFRDWSLRWRRAVVRLRQLDKSSHSGHFALSTKWWVFPYTGFTAFRPEIGAPVGFDLRACHAEHKHNCFNGSARRCWFVPACVGCSWLGLVRTHGLRASGPQDIGRIIPNLPPATGEKIIGAIQCVRDVFLFMLMTTRPNNQGASRDAKEVSSLEARGGSRAGPLRA